MCENYVSGAIEAVAERKRLTQVTLAETLGVSKGAVAM